MAAQLSNFIDIHTHLLPGMDDGPQSFEESVALAGYYSQLGIKKVITTPHYIPGTAWSVSRDQVLESLEKLQLLLREKGIPLEIYPGMEIAFHKNILNRLTNDSLLPLGTSSYYLLEPSFNDSLDALLQCVKDLMESGWSLILAHPERIRSFQHTLQPLIALVQQGLKVQMNIGSLLGKFGSKSRETGQKLLELDCVHFLASDAHGADKRRPPDKKEWLDLHNLLGEQLLKQLCSVNPSELLSKQ